MSLAWSTAGTDGWLFKDYTFLFFFHLFLICVDSLSFQAS